MNQLDGPRAMPRSVKTVVTVACMVLIGAGIGFLLGAL